MRCRPPPFRHVDRPPDGLELASTAANFGKRRLLSVVAGPSVPIDATGLSEQVGIDPQSCDQADLTADRGDKVEGGEAGLGDDDEAAIHHLARRQEGVEHLDRLGLTREP